MKNILAFFESLSNNFNEPNVKLVNKYGFILKHVDHISTLEPHLFFNSTTYKLYIIL